LSAGRLGVDKERRRTRGDDVASSSAEFHEAPDDLRPETRDRHRGIVSLMEELEAVDWYDQRIDAAGDEGLRAILRHNRDEEKEHAAMVLEWIRRRDQSFDEKLREYLFTEGSLVGRERAVEADELRGNGAAASRTARVAATVGSLRGGR
jgi:ferritin-like protein